MGYDQDQNTNIDTVLNVGMDLSAPILAIEGALCAGAGENDWHTDGCNSSDHCGFWQLDSGWQAMHDYRDVEFWTRYAYLHGFFGHGGIVHIAQSNPGLPPGWVAQYCQGAGPTDAQAAAYYQQFAGLARQLIDSRIANYTPGNTKPVVPIIDQGTPGLGSVAGDFDSSSLIRAGADAMGLHGQRASTNANRMLAYVQSVDYCTPGGAHASK